MQNHFTNNLALILSENFAQVKERKRKKKPTRIVFESISFVRDNPIDASLYRRISNLELLLAFCGVHRYSQKKKIRFPGFAGTNHTAAVSSKERQRMERQRLRELSRCLSMLSSWSGRFSRKPREWIYHLDINGLGMWTPCNAFLSLGPRRFYTRHPDIPSYLYL